jgi:putative hydrolase of the HAD superfamily
VRAVLFDVDGVLVHGYHTDYEKRRRWDQHLEADVGIDPEIFTERFIRTIFRDEVLTGAKSLVSAMEEARPELGFAESPMSVISYWISRDTQLNHPLLNGVRRLRPDNIRLLIATNQEHLRAFYLWNALGLQHIFEDMFHSARIGATKPNPAFFERLDAKIGPQDETPLMFDDDPRVVEAATEHGWEAVQYGTLADFTEHPWIAAQLAAHPSHHRQ